MSDANQFPPPDFDADLAALSAAAEPWVARLAVPDQRIQAAPDARNIRFYQTSGLLDRPQRYDGRTAKYGRRHLLQLVAIRALQSKGLSLAQVQASMAGATDRELQQVINSALSASVRDGVASARAQGNTVAAPAPTPAQSLLPEEFAAPSGSTLIAVELVPGVVVTIDSRLHSNSAQTLNALRRALASAPEASNDAPQGDLS